MLVAVLVAFLVVLVVCLAVFYQKRKKDREQAIMKVYSSADLVGSSGVSQRAIAETQLDSTSFISQQGTLFAVPDALDPRHAVGVPHQGKAFADPMSSNEDSAHVAQRDSIYSVPYETADASSNTVSILDANGSQLYSVPLDDNAGPRLVYI